MPMLVLELLAPQLRPDARLEHFELARLGDEIVSAGAQAVDHGSAIFARGQHHQRYVTEDGRSLDASTGFDAVQIRHQQIEQDAVDRLCGQHLERGCAGARGHDLVALGLQHSGKLVQVGGAVVDRQDTLRIEQAGGWRALGGGAAQHGRQTRHDQLDVFLTHESVGAGVERAQLCAVAFAGCQEHARRAAQSRVEADAPNQRGAVDARHHAVDQDCGRPDAGGEPKPFFARAGRSDRVVVGLQHAP